MIEVVPLKDEAFGAVVTGVTTDRPLTPDEAQALETEASRIENPRLRAAIVALGKAVLSADP